MVLAANSVGGGPLAMYRLLLRGPHRPQPACPAGPSLLSRFQMGLGHLLVTSFQVTLRHLPQTLLLILLLFVTVWATAGFFPLAVFTPRSQRTARLHTRGARHPPVSPREGALEGEEL